MPHIIFWRINSFANPVKAGIVKSRSKHIILGLMTNDSVVSSGLILLRIPINSFANPVKAGIVKSRSKHIILGLMTKDSVVSSGLILLRGFFRINSFANPGISKSRSKHIILGLVTKNSVVDSALLLLRIPSRQAIPNADLNILYSGL
ncbi:unnamed protein product [Allacma fusca]|uniref:Uncharacterized protein n=1 Tax=Allacma fusca TaxID=39272 RepID=A0A8J2KS97_9HEXA|nr:unnamed protein product [Allacma fusca]